jgi:hypothetical protein
MKKLSLRASILTLLSLLLTAPQKALVISEENVDKIAIVSGAAASLNGVNYAVSRTAALLTYMGMGIGTGATLQGLAAGAGAGIGLGTANTLQRFGATLGAGLFAPVFFLPAIRFLPVELAAPMVACATVGGAVSYWFTDKVTHWILDRFTPYQIAAWAKYEMDRIEASSITQAEKLSTYGKIYAYLNDVKKHLDAHNVDSENQYHLQLQKLVDALISKVNELIEAPALS